MIKDGNNGIVTIDSNLMRVLINATFHLIFIFFSNSL
jgi:hypothetical protein